MPLANFVLCRWKTQEKIDACFFPVFTLAKIRKIGRNIILISQSMICMLIIGSWLPGIDHQWSVNGSV
jgi:hypothetical protein